VLMIDVVERNTIVINDVRMGISADADTHGNKRPLTAYAGIDVAETNLLGTGITLGSAMAVAEQQLALRVRFLDPAFLGSSWMTGGTLLYNDARDFFGNAFVLKEDPLGTSPSQSAVVNYKRFGGALGVGRDLSISTQLWLYYRLETLDASYPLEASHLRGYRTEPIDFDIIRGRSVLSALRSTTTRAIIRSCPRAAGMRPSLLKLDFSLPARTTTTSVPRCRRLTGGDCRGTNTCCAWSCSLGQSRATRRSSSNTTLATSAIFCLHASWA